MKKLRFGLATAMFLGSFMILLGACQEEFATKIEKHDINDTISVDLTQPKVLYLIVDGLRGQILPQINPPTLTNMTRHAVFAYNGVSNDYANNPSAWADMLTGVSPKKHMVTSANIAGNDLEEYPMFFERIKQANAQYRTAAFCSSDFLSNRLVSHADINKSFQGNDKAAKNAIIEELSTDSATVVLGEFNNVQEAGEIYGYDSSVREYVEAIFQFDQYVSDIMEALKQRKNYENEDWMVIIASNRGGAATIPVSQQDNTKFSVPKLNTFAIIYNTKFSTRFIPRPNVANLPYEGYAVKLSGSGDSPTDYGDALNAYVPADEAAIYNFGSEGEYTVQIKVKVFDFGSVWPSFFGKRESSYNRSEPGWMFMFHGDNEWRVKIGGNVSTGAQYLEDSAWHTLTLKVYEEGGKRLAAIYTDGAKGTPVDVTGDDMTNNFPLTAGWADGWGSGNVKMYITDVKIYDTALSDNYIDTYGGNVGLTKSSPYYDNIIGYWPCTDGIGEKFTDKGPYHNDMIINVTDKNESDFTWKKFSDLSGLIHVPLSKAVFKEVPRGVDLPLIIYKWMGLKVADWNLDGRFWIPNYTK